MQMSNDKLTLIIKTPEGTSIKKEALFVQFNSKSGEIGIFPNHEPSLFELKPGSLVTKESEDLTITHFIPEGIAQVMPEGITILTPYIEDGSIIDASRAQKSLERATTRLKRPESHIDVERARQSLIRAEERLFIVEQRN